MDYWSKPIGNFTVYSKVEKGRTELWLVADESIMTNEQHAQYVDDSNGVSYDVKCRLDSKVWQMSVRKAALVNADYCYNTLKDRGLAVQLWKNFSEGHPILVKECEAM